jgi:DNA processing protein
VPISTVGQQNEPVTTRPVPSNFLPTERLLGPLNEVERKNAPARLFFAGEPILLQRGSRVSIVGSRKATPEGIARAHDLAQALVARGVTVVSGLAEGIDSAAHEATIAGGGHTIGVLGTPLEKFFPAKNRRLQLEMMRDHLVVSQFAPGTAVRPGNFPMRNRTMALLSDATVIVEAGEKSGSLHQGWEALRLGRPLFIFESAYKDPNLTWPGAFKEYGAEALVPNQLEALFELLPAKARGEVTHPAF